MECPLGSFYAIVTFTISSPYNDIDPQCISMYLPKKNIYLWGEKWIFCIMKKMQ